MTVAGTLRRNRKITITTSATASISSNCTSDTEARIVVVRSVSSDTSTLPGSVSFNCGSSALARLTTSITLAPGWRCTFRMMAGVVLDQAASLLFSAPSTICATSVRRMGAPFL